jgi:serine phosphatase RsbU (regulator of sigma subunit)
LLFRDQRSITEERALLAGEMQAASEIQHMLAPVKLETAPGLKIDVVFHPMREVGGDFYLSRVLPDGRQRVLAGDVSGKGAAAAMAAALLLGAAEERNDDSPGELLLHLNRVLRRTRIGGFATCLCADVAADGAVTIANAGHLAPYLNGQPLEIEGALPLGMIESAEFSVLNFTLQPGDRLVIVSDGVVEARDAKGDLLGFERMTRLMTKSASEVASAAQLWGQEDDITVLALQFAPVSAAHG